MRRKKLAISVFMISIQIVVVTILGIRLFDDKFCGLFYSILAIYAIPTEIGYLFFSSIPKSLNTYYGTEVWWQAYWFIFLSFIMFYIGTRFFLKTKKRVGLTIVEKNVIRGGDKVIIFLLWMYSVSVLALFVLNYSDINYFNISTNGFTNSHFMVKLFINLYLLQIPITVVIVSVILHNNMLSKKYKAALKRLCVFNILSFIVYISRTGARSALISLFIGVLIIIFLSRKMDIALLIRLLIVSVIIIIAMISILHKRDASTLLYTNTYEKLLRQDYFFPSLNLYVSIAKEFVKPIELLKDNFLNILPGGNTEPIHFAVGKLFTNSVGTSTGFGFYIFTEGYIFAGMVGVLYNGFCIAWLLCFWRKIATTNDKNFNIALLGIMSSYFFSIVRSESMYFIRNLIYIIPCMIIYSLMTNKSIKLVVFRRKE